MVGAEAVLTDPIGGNGEPGHVKIATAVQAFWSQIGIKTNIKVLEWKQYLQFLGPPPN